MATIVIFNNFRYTLDTDATLTNRVFPGWFGDAEEGEHYTAEYSATATLLNGDTVEIIWQFDEIKGQEKEDEGGYDWDNPIAVNPL